MFANIRISFRCVLFKLIKFDLYEKNILRNQI